MTPTVYGFAFMVGCIVGLVIFVIALKLELELVRKRLQYLEESRTSQNEVNKAVQNVFNSHGRMIDLHWDYMRATDQSGRIMHRQIEELQRTKAEKETW